MVFWMFPGLIYSIVFKVLYSKVYTLGYVMFIDRIEELGWLEEKWRSGKGELLLVYGRRRVGKTRLLWEWMKGKRVFYFVAEEVPEKRLLERLSVELSEFTGDDLLRERPFTSWRQFFLYLYQIARKHRIGVVLDEFQYAVATSPGLLSQLQAVWDTRLKDTRVFLVLMGSLVSFSEGILSQRNPLYGRLSGAIKVRPMSPFQSRCFVVKYNPDDAIRLYAVFGGVPGYLEEINPRITFWDNVRRLFFQPNARFLDEAKYLLREELREVSRYFAVLEAIANGATKFGEISSKTGVPGESLSKYLKVLESMGIISRLYPVLPGGRPIYRITDRFLEFWFRYIPRYRGSIELGLTKKVVEAVSRDFETSLLPKAWEITTHYLVGELAKQGKLDMTPTRIGHWWYKDIEIDLVALDETESPPKILVGEAKWREINSREARRILDRLRAKAEFLPTRRGDIIYLLAVKKLMSQPDLLPGELILSLKEFDELSMKTCKAKRVTSK